VWFTIGQGVLNEVYYPDVDHACVRDIQFLTSDGKDFFSEERKDTNSEIAYLAAGAPAFKLVNTCGKGRYRIEKEILTDPHRDVVLQQVRFIPLQYSLSHYHLFALLSPHLENHGSDNTAFIDDYKGVPMLFAERESTALALASSAPWLMRSVGYVGVSDGWQDIHDHKQMAWTYTRAENGNVALTGEVDLQSCRGEFLLALGFGGTPAEAAHRARASIINGFSLAKSVYVSQWQAWQRNLPFFSNLRDNEAHLPLVSSCVLRAHEAKSLPGALISSLSIPWGFAKGDDDLGGYRLVWPRDLVEAAGALLALGAKEDVHRILRYLRTTQEAEGHWPQNMHIDGSKYWHGVQLDETAFPILLVDLARRNEALESDDLVQLWPMVKKAAGFIIRTGPAAGVERCDEEAAYSPFTLAVEIASLLAAADVADTSGQAELAAYFRQTADCWNSNIERWTYMKDTELARRLDIEGYYARFVPSDLNANAAAAPQFDSIEHHVPDYLKAPLAHMISSDFLALVRLGLRMPDDPRIANTVKAVDVLLRVETPTGPMWRRFNNDTYGEHEDGSPFDGSGRGRLWPLLVGERAHYELAAGRRREAERLLNVLEQCANAGGMIPEQVWDGPDAPERGLFFGKPTGAATPLVCAHAEYLKLLRSLRDNRIFDLPVQTVHRYLIAQTSSAFVSWRMDHHIRKTPQGKALRVELPAPAVIHCSSDHWNSTTDIITRDTGIGIWLGDLPTAHLPPNATVHFTFYWIDSKQWEGKDFQVIIASQQDWEK
jgi:glucoamylase